MDVSVVIATYNQKERLRLVLRGLTQQTVPVHDFEVIVVIDGCTDGTDAAVTEFSSELNLRLVILPDNLPRNMARNKGVEVADGQLIAFLDGDALPHPRWLAEHLHAGSGPSVQAGAEYSLAQTEYLRDPETGEPMVPITPSVVREYIRIHKADMVVTQAMVMTDFSRLELAAVKGGYPFSELAEVQNQISELFAHHPQTPIGWVAAYPHNLMVPRDVLMEVGGFAPEVEFHDGWELAYRIMQLGLHTRFVESARTYHLYHYHEFSDARSAQREQLERCRTLNYLATKFDDRRFLLLHMWHAAIWPDPLVPEEMRISTLLELHEQFCVPNPERVRDVEALMRLHPVWGSTAGAWNLESFRVGAGH